MGLLLQSRGLVVLQGLVDLQERIQQLVVQQVLQVLVDRVDLQGQPQLLVDQADPLDRAEHNIPGKELGLQQPSIKQMIVWKMTARDMFAKLSIHLELLRPI